MFVHFETIAIRVVDAVAYLELARPHARNAFDATVVAELTAATLELATRRDIRIVVLSGAGTHFCAGADLQYMRAGAYYSPEENRADARRVIAMLEAIDSLPQAVIGRIQGAALGGGMGLVAVCDVAVAAETTVFGLTETRLGLLPAMIGPFVLAKIGYSALRAYGTTGERFTAATALQLGLVHAIAAIDDLDARVSEYVTAYLACAPGAVSQAKSFFQELAYLPHDAEARRAICADAIADRRASDEAKAGLTAFFERKPAPWQQ